MLDFKKIKYVKTKVVGHNNTPLLCTKYQRLHCSVNLMQHKKYIVIFFYNHELKTKVDQ